MSEHLDLPPEFNLTEAYVTFMEGLKAASSEARLDGRGGAISALQSVIGFLEVAPKPRDGECSLALTKLLAALHDLEQGRVPALLRPCKGGGAPPDTTLRRTVKGAASAAVDVLIARGSSVEQACRFVAAPESRSRDRRQDERARFDGRAWLARAPVAITRQQSGAAHA